MAAEQEKMLEKSVFSESSPRYCPNVSLAEPEPESETGPGVPWCTLHVHPPADQRHCGATMYTPMRQREVHIWAS